MRRTAALIVGGGPAGSAAAITLARGGVAPEVIERTQGPHDVVCGGFLGWDALAALSCLGIDAAALGARPIGRLRLVSGRRTVEAALPRSAAGLSRRRLDAALLAAASGAGAHVLRGRTARCVDVDQLSVRLDGEEEVQADALFLATGKHEFRGAPRAVGRDSGDLAVGLRAAIRAGPALRDALDGFIELHLFDGGYAGLLLQEDGAANLCLSVARSRLARAGGVEGLMDEVFAEAPLLRRRADPRPLEWAAIAGVPYGWSENRTSPGLFRVGDAAAVIASLAGDGVAIALTSGAEAANALLSEGRAGAPAYQRGFAQGARRPLAVAEALRFAAERPLARSFLTPLARLPGLPGLAARLTRIR